MRSLAISDASDVFFFPTVRLCFLPKHGVVRFLRVVEMARKWRRTSCNVEDTSLCGCVCLCVGVGVWDQVKVGEPSWFPTLLRTHRTKERKGKERKEG